MRILIIALCGITACLTTQAEEGFQIAEYPGYDDLATIPHSGFTVHQPDRPQPKRLIPPETNGETGPIAPSDAIVLFDGTSLEQFQETTWQVVDGHIIAGEDSLKTITAYGDFQLHVEWRTPNPPNLSHPGNIGNSGLYIMGSYELQIYDSYTAKIYADGSAAAIYGQTPPLVNVCRKPGEWQTYDIAFTAPVFDHNTLVSPARITVFHNGFLVQNNTKINGPTGHKKANSYTPHAPKSPLVFQGHNSPVEFRNIWIRDL